MTPGAVVTAETTEPPPDTKIQRYLTGNVDARPDLVKVPDLVTSTTLARRTIRLRRMRNVSPLRLGQMRSYCITGISS